MGRVPVVVLGAGPAGLGAAFQLARRGQFDVTVLERGPVVGGNAGSFELDGLRVDYGSHRLHPACSPEVLADIRALLGSDLLDRPRHGRIRLAGRWVHFPLEPVDLALHVPPRFLLGVARDALTKGRGSARDQSFEAVLEHGLGRTICREFYFPYARKIWGVAPGALDAEQARRRVAAGSMTKLARKVLAAIPGLKPEGSGRFFYPRHGYGEISEAYHRAAVEAGARVHLGHAVSRVATEDGRVVGIEARSAGDDGLRLPARVVLSTIPLPALAGALSPGVAPEVVASATALHARAMLLVYLVLGTDRFSEYDAHYFPGLDVAITRLSEPKNYGLADLPGTTVLCAELPCTVEDAVWKASDAELGTLVDDALAASDLPIAAPIRRVVTRRLPHAYPVYTRDYRQHFDRLDASVGGVEGLLTFGRQGLFAHDNTHHTLAMAYAAVECLDGDGRVDRTRWAVHRRAFESHVVED